MMVHVHTQLQQCFNHESSTTDYKLSYINMLHEFKSKTFNFKEQDLLKIFLHVVMLAT
jgi:hypothetical protein